MRATGRGVAIMSNVKSTCGPQDKTKSWVRVWMEFKQIYNILFKSYRSEYGYSYVLFIKVMMKVTIKMFSDNNSAMLV